MMLLDVPRPFHGPGVVPGFIPGTHWLRGKATPGEVRFPAERRNARTRSRDPVARVFAGGNIEKIRPYRSPSGEGNGSRE